MRIPFGAISARALNFNLNTLFGVYTQKHINYMSVNRFMGTGNALCGSLRQTTHAPGPLQVNIDDCLPIAIDWVILCLVDGSLVFCLTLSRLFSWLIG